MSRVDLDGFWSLIERSARDAGPDPAARHDRLFTALTWHPVEEIVDFQIHLDRCRRQLDSYATWGAADLVFGGAGTDCFWYFLVWVIGLGREAFERVAADPDNLADLPLVRQLAGRTFRDWDDAEWPWWEDLGYVARGAYDHVTGEEEGIITAMEARGHHSPEDPAPRDDPTNRAYPRLQRLFPPNRSRRRR
jgi:hypothetical protein